MVRILQRCMYAHVGLTDTNIRVVWSDIIGVHLNVVANSH